MQFFKRWLNLKRERLTTIVNCMIVKFPCCYQKSLAFIPYLELRISKKPANVRHTESSPSEVFLRKDVLEISRRFTGEHPYRSAISCKFAAYFQNIFSQ